MSLANAERYQERLLNGATLRSLAAEEGKSYQAISAEMRRAGINPDDIRKQVIESTQAPKEPLSPKRHCHFCGKELLISERGVHDPTRPSWCATNRACQNDRFRYLYWHTDRRDKHKMYTKIREGKV